MKRSTPRWFGHIERMGSEESVKKVHRSESVGPNSRRSPLRWRDRVKEYMCERGAARGARVDQARREFGQGEVEIFLLCPHPWRTFPGVRHLS